MLRLSVFALIFFFIRCSRLFPNCARSKIKSNGECVCFRVYSSLSCFIFRFKTEILTSSVHKINAVEVCYEMCNCYPVGVDFGNVVSLPRIKEMAFKLPLKMENYCLASLSRRNKTKQEKNQNK